MNFFSWHFPLHDFFLFFPTPPPPPPPITFLMVRPLDPLEKNRCQQPSHSRKLPPFGPLPLGISVALRGGGGGGEFSGATHFHLIFLRFIRVWE